MIYTRFKEGIGLLIASLIVLTMAWRLSDNRAPDFSQATARYADGTLVQLDAQTSPQQVSRLLIDHTIFSDSLYADWVATRLVELLATQPLPNVGALNKRAYQVPAAEVAKAGTWGRKRYDIAQVKLGQDAAYTAAVAKSLPATLSVHDAGGYRIAGRVTNHEGQPQAALVVRLRRELTKHVRDSIEAAFWEQRKQEDNFMTVDADTRSRIIPDESYFVKTDAEGRYAFEGLVAGQNYSVQPIAIGQQFGTLRGVSAIDHNVEGLNFVGREHRMPLFDQASFAQVRALQLFSVRTPAAASDALLIGLVWLLGSFWCLHLCLALCRRSGDQYVAPLLLLLVGISTVVLFALQDPLRDLDYGSSTAQCAAIVVLGAAVLSFVPTAIWVRVVNFSLPAWLHSRGADARVVRFLAPLGKPQGLLFLAGSILLLLLLAIVGTGPEGSGVKVNIGTIQVSELSKYLMVAFMAYFFTAHHHSFREIQNNVYLWRRYCLAMLVGFVVLMGLYVGVVGDQGPALVLCLTFLIYYAYARNEFGALLLAAVGYGALLWVLSLWLSGTMLAIVSGLLVVGLLLYAWRVRRYESMGFVVLLMASFVVLQQLPFDFAERLAERNSMFTNTWHNPLHGGDQVAQGIWALASGGLWGQGLGVAQAHVMPAYHTDMMFESLGEVLGSVALLGILVCFVVLFFRTMLIARGTGHRLLFYLIVGSGLVTLVQAAIIIGGSLGLMPLTGISLPFLSKGNSGLMINLAVFLLILLYSSWRGTAESQAVIGRQFDHLNTYVLLTFSGVALCFAVTLGVYWWKAEAYMVRPVQVLSRQGEWLYSENPRIKRIARQLQAGNIYDRKGLLLATSERDAFLKARSEAAAHGANMEAYNKQTQGQQRRYYPYSDALLLWLGDANRMLAMNESQGFAAEQRLLPQLRGFATPVLATSTATSDSYHEAPYLPAERHTSTLVERDYSAFVPLLKAGPRSSLIAEHNASRDRDVRLSVDLHMQQLVAQLLQQPQYSMFKTSAVIIKTNTGDVLTSANAPMPSAVDLQTIGQFAPRYYDMLLSTFYGYNHLVADRDFALMEATTPGSVVKPIDAWAYLNRQGLAGTGTAFAYTAGERIRADEPTGMVDMRMAIVRSSNLYFVSLINEKEIHPELFDLYHSVGVSYYGQGGFALAPPKNYDAEQATAAWMQRLTPDKGKAYRNPRLARTPKRYKGADYSWMAWGQGPITATPLHFARLFGALANGGALYANRFVVEQGGVATPAVVEQQLNKHTGVPAWLDATLAAQPNSGQIATATQVAVRGKTGSPERITRHYDSKRQRTHTQRTTDAWFVCYLPQADYEGSPLALCVRIQGIGGSKHAATLAQAIIKTLKANGMAKH